MPSSSHQSTAHFLQGDGDSKQGFSIEHAFWDPTRGIVADRQWVGPNATTQAKPAAGDPATMFAADSNQQHIDGGIYQVYWDPNSGQSWERWA